METNATVTTTNQAHGRVAYDVAGVSFETTPATIDSDVNLFFKAYQDGTPVAIGGTDTKLSPEAVDNVLTEMLFRQMDDIMQQMGG